MYRGESETMDTEDDEFPVLLQVSLHALSECLSMFQGASNGGMGGGFRGGFEGVRTNAFLPARGTVRLVYEGDGEPFLVMYSLAPWPLLSLPLWVVGGLLGG